MVAIRVLYCLGVVTMCAAGTWPCLEAYCPRASVDSIQRGDGKCDLLCMSPMCGYDQGSGSTSDCQNKCSTTCSSGLGDGICDQGKSSRQSVILRSAVGTKAIAGYVIKDVSAMQVG